MARRAITRTTTALAATLGFAVVSLTAGCTGEGDEVDLNKSDDSAEVGIPDVPVPPADGPRLGALANMTPVYDRPSTDGKKLGYLHAGASVARAEEPYSKKGCEGGWYPIRPRGFVCAGESASTDLNHPTMKAMALQPKLDAPLPYAYARTRKQTPFFDRDPNKEAGVVKKDETNTRTGFAVVGSWFAEDDEGKRQRLGLLTNGRFVRAADLRKSNPSEFSGYEIGKQHELPIGFVVKRGVRRWKVAEGKAEKLDKLEYHEKLALTGRFRTVRGQKYWADEEDKYYRHRDVTVARRRNVFPDFVDSTTKWIDVSIITGVLTAYEGKRPVYVTLCSVGRDRLGDPKETASTAQGVFEVTAKHITHVGADPKSFAQYYPLHDVPWVMELSSGQKLLGAYWTNRFGIEHGPGNVMVSPADARWLWSWATPELPEGWHGAFGTAKDEQKTFVLVRK